MEPRDPTECIIGANPRHRMRGCGLHPRTPAGQRLRATRLSRSPTFLILAPLQPPQAARTTHRDDVLGPHILTYASCDPLRIRRPLWSIPPRRFVEAHTGPRRHALPRQRARRVQIEPKEESTSGDVSPGRAIASTSIWRGQRNQYTMSSEYRSASSRRALVISSRCPTGWPSRSTIGTAMTLSQLITPASVRPCSGPSSTSDRIPRIVRVIGAHVTDASTSIAASRVSTHTGRRPAGGPRSAQYMSLRATTQAWS